MHTVGSPILWLVFSAVVLVLLAFDLGVLHRVPRQPRMWEALVTTLVWVAVAMLFAGGLWYFYGRQPALEFVTGYVIEETLSVDNLFVFMVIFSYFGVPRQDQHRVLFWGILGALIMRGLFIGAGAALLHAFHGVFYIFGAFLVITGIKLFVQKDNDVQPENLAVRMFRRWVPATPTFEGSQFIVKRNGRNLATPLLLVLVAVEVSDILFAVDSIPAIFGVTTDPFIVYTSNVFAIMGLRSLYFMLAGLMGQFRYLKYGLGLVLSFVGAKMLLADVYAISTPASLLVISVCLGGAIAVSLLRKPVITP